MTFLVIPPPLMLALISTVGVCHRCTTQLRPHQNNLHPEQRKQMVSYRILPPTVMMLGV
jgi:hypothetical protein